jgi:hypothetical protein
LSADLSVFRRTGRFDFVGMFINLLIDIKVSIEKTVYKAVGYSICRLNYWN